MNTNIQRYFQISVSVLLNVTIKVLENYPDTKIYIEENLKELTVEEVIYFVFEFFE